MTPNQTLEPATGPYFAQGTPAMEALEAMVDRVGLANVLYALEFICGEKADHLACNWQDKVAAGTWQKKAVKLARCAMAVGT